MSKKATKPLYRCPHCGECAVNVLDSRPLEISAEPIIRRRRACVSCSHRWSTFEITDAAYAAICDAVEILQEMFPRVVRRTPDANGMDDVENSPNGGGPQLR